VAPRRGRDPDQWREALAPASCRFILLEAKKAGYESKDHSEFLVGISIRDLNALYSKAIEIGLAVDAEEEPV
jgi:hypothetical protein